MIFIVITFKCDDIEDNGQDGRRCKHLSLYRIHDHIQHWIYL